MQGKSQPPPLAYVSPEKPEQWVHLPLLIWMLVIASLFTILFLATFFKGPKIEEVFKDFGTKLPHGTVALISLTRGRMIVWTLSTLWGAALGLPVLAAVIKTQGARRVVTRLAVVASLLTFITSLVFLLMPVFRLIQATSGTPSKK